MLWRERPLRPLSSPWHMKILRSPRMAALTGRSAEQPVMTERQEWAESGIPSMWA